MSLRKLHGAMWLGACLLCLWVPDVAAFQRTRTSLGIPVFWKDPVVPFWIGKGGSRDIEGDADIEAIKKAAEVWSNVSCSQAQLVFQGLLDAPKAEYLKGQANQNVVYWVEDPETWPDSLQILALTTVNYDPASGELQDADLQLNGRSFKWSAGDTVGEGLHDVMNTVTHEFGHVLGLDHSLRVDATMFGGAPVGETKKRDLDPDDIEGLCSIYGKTEEDRLRFDVVAVDDSRRSCPDPHPSFEAPPPPNAGCQGSPSSFDGTGWMMFLIMAVVMLGFRFRRERRS
ncbi:MAG: matrixin family metalloprotease [Myxococcales bacterium]|nr:matrixin family metalloprotease [Myxococcales bacterium]